MYNIEVHKRVEQTISLFYFIGVWHDENRSDFHKWCLNIMHLLVCISYTTSVAVAAFTSDNITEASFLAVTSIANFVQAIRLYYFMWKNQEILRFLRSMGAHSIEGHQDFIRVNNKINLFIKFATFCYLLIFFGLLMSIIFKLPIITKQKSLPVNIYFPMDWKNNEVTYWIAFSFTGISIMVVVVYSVTNPVIWYLMMCCAMKYQILGNEFSNLGKNKLKKPIFLHTKNQDSFHDELIVLIKKHQAVQEYESFR